jgi:hypothetical protein
MNQKNIIIALIAIIVGLVVLIFVVKGKAASAAQEHVKKTLENSNFQMSQVRDNIENNNLLWTLIDSTWKSPEKSIAFVKKLADSQKLPRCKGKPCEGDEARLKTTITNNANEKSIKVGWTRYSFKVLFDPKETKRDKFVTIDASDLLGKNTQQESSEEGSEEE